MPSWVWSLRLRITLAATAVLSVALLIASFALVISLERTLIGRVREQAVRQVGQVAEAVEQGQPLSARLLANVVTSGVLVRILDESGQVVATIPSEVGPRVVMPGPGLEPEILPFELPARGDLVREVHTGELVIASRTVDSPVGRRTVVAVSPLAEVAQSVDSVVRALRVGTPLLAVIAGFITWMVVRRSLRPIESMRSRVEEITHATLDERLPVPDTGDEVERLATTLNDMLNRLEQAVRRQREFVSDASHELRSPVAAIRTALEVALTHPDGSDWEELVRRVLQENLRLEALVDDLLQLARLEERGARPGRVELDEMLREEAARVEPPATALTVQLHLEPAAVWGDSDQLRRVVRNLLDNALRHARSRVDVSTFTSDGNVLLHVDDDGPGIPPEDRERVFERFTRLEQGRTRTSGGIGIGLAIVQSVVSGHGGTVRAMESPRGGARFEVVLKGTSGRDPRGLDAVEPGRGTHLDAHSGSSG
ncbi:MAG: ATP-binding protein [Nitriliruptorales bacterium]